MNVNIEGSVTKLESGFILNFISLKPVLQYFFAKQGMKSRKYDGTAWAG
jgi:hypothetical protein